MMSVNTNSTLPKLVFLIQIVIVSLLTSLSFGQVLTTSDTGLNTGKPTSLTYTAPSVAWPFLPVFANTDPSKVLWHFGPDPYGIKVGTGTIKMNYDRDGRFTIAVNLSGLDPKVHVDAYPFMQYGGNCFGATPCQQPPRFPIQLSKLSSLVIDVQYNLTGTFTGSANILFDQWLVPKEGYDKGQKGSVEVEIMPFYYGPSRWGVFKKNMTLSAILNGNATNLTFAEYVAISAEGRDVLFYPADGSEGIRSGAIKFDALPLHLEAASQTGVGNDWLVSGVTIGNEFGDSTSENFTFVLQKSGVDQQTR